MSYPQDASLIQSLIKYDDDFIEFTDIDISQTQSKNQFKFHEKGPDINTSQFKFHEKGPDIITSRLESIVNFDARSIYKNTNSESSINTQSYREFVNLDNQDSKVIEYYMPLDKLERLLKTNYKTGLSDAIIVKNQIKFGPNLIEQKKTSRCYALLQQFNLFTIILIIAALITLLQAVVEKREHNRRLMFKAFTLTILLLVVATVNTLLQFYQQLKSFKLIDQFMANIPTQCQVIRNNILLDIDVTNLVPGDIIEITESSAIPADLRMICSNDMKVYIVLNMLLVDNSLFTGDKTPIQITIDAINQGNILESSHIAFFGAICKEGSGRGVVIAIGSQTAIGQINIIAKKRKEKKSILKQELLKFEILITILLILCFSGSVVVMNYGKDLDFSKACIFIVVIITGFIPEGLQVSIAISLSMSMRRLAKKYVLLRDTNLVEALSETTCICMHLQGVLTLNKFNVHSVFYNGNMYMATDFKQSQKAKFHVNDIFAEIYKCCIITSEHKSFLYKGEQKQIQFISNLSQRRSESLNQRLEIADHTQSELIDLNEDSVITTDATEKAMLKFFSHYDDPIVLINNTDYARSCNGIQFKVPFNSSKKYSLAVVKNPQGSNQNGFFTVYIKGSSEVIWKMCSKMYVDNELVEINCISDSPYLEYEDSMTKISKRMVGLAFKKLPSYIFHENYIFNLSGESFDFSLDEFSFLGSLSLLCQLRRGVKEILQDIQASGIKLVVMQDSETGENAQTAQSIMTQCGLGGKTKYLQGTDLYTNFEQTEENGITKITSAQLTTWCQGRAPIIFTQMDPQQKVQIVRACQTLGFKVAVTGEKVADITSFKYAHVSVASLYTSSHPCLEACDVRLTNKKDSFLALLPAVLESRRAIDNINKSILFILTSNTAKIIAILIFVLARIPIPMNEIQMLTVSALTDLLTAIGFAREESELTMLKKRQIMSNKIMSLRTFIISFALLGIIEGAAVVFTFNTAMLQFGFKWESIQDTQFKRGFKTNLSQTFNINSSTLGNPYLNKTNGSNPNVCNVSQDYGKDQVIFEWQNATQQQWDQRQVFVYCTNCSQEQINHNQANGIEYCWYYVNKHSRQPLLEYQDGCFQNFESEKDSDSDSVSDLKYSCYKGQSMLYAQTSAFVTLVICQCLNYFALRTQHSSYRYTQFNKLAISGLVLSILALPLLIYTPGIQYIFQTASIPWYMFGVAGLPFAMLLLIVEEIRKNVSNNI